MQIQFIAYPGCSTCRNAEKYLKEHHISYTFRHVVNETPTVEELTTWLKRTNYPIKKLLNTSGKVYQTLQLKERLTTMSDEEILTLLSQNGMLIKRPLLISEKQVCAGFREDRYDAFFSSEDFV